ncbi:folate-binding protein YgfZ [Thermomonas sp. HDW16]|uniref:CAF17-like 4Fe-4S cluster assembly/insertion protein YgfZ n=1 Tax=Thermomonas sp. HDW16 TaxID=2714945 RepID=UPI00140A3899|nr:folate-binding protein YgfZ [Thermomonas sp. HDW16]QIL20481.1 folate-binding protein YgfZ [Thermomonas sp. HDW16]
MSHNPQAASALEFNLPGHDVLALEGRDAVAFAQAQFMNDVAALADGQWQWNGWLTPKGRVIALFALLRFDAEKLWLVLPDVLSRDLATQLQRYVFRSKVTLKPMDMCSVGSFDAPYKATGASFAVFEEGEVELDMGGEGGPRCLQISYVPAPENEEAAARWNAADLAYGLPRLRDAQVEAWTPQQLSLDRLKAFSVKKGCYPGQEIVARTHFLGQVKRGLALFESATPFEAGSEVRADERAIGSIVSTAGSLALAVMPLDADTASLTVGETALTPRPLLGGLQR